jgi:hypothetical protein
VQYRGNVLLWPKSDECKKSLVLFYLFTLWCYVSRVVVLFKAAAAAGDPTRGREGRSEAASAADGAAGKGNMNSSHKANAY